MLSTLVLELLILADGVLLVVVQVPLVDLGFVHPLLEVGLVPSNAVGRAVRGSCASFDVALQLRGRVRSEYPR